jgi:hypothetical protein
VDCWEIVKARARHSAEVASITAAILPTPFEPESPNAHELTFATVPEFRIGEAENHPSPVIAINRLARRISRRGSRCAKLVRLDKLRYGYLRPGRLARELIGSDGSGTVPACRLKASMNATMFATRDHVKIARRVASS